MTSSFAKQVAEIEKKRKEPIINVGNLDARRDFTDVRDIVRAYCMAVEKCTPGEVYNICSGRSVKMKDLLDLFLSKSKVKIKIVQDDTLLRPSDVPILVGDSTKFRKITGWKPEYSLEQSSNDILNYWRSLV